MFSAGSIKHTMRSLDACVTGAYLDTPFTHRLERPIQESVERVTRPKSAVMVSNETVAIASSIATTESTPPTPTPTRRRRSAAPVGRKTLEEKGLEGGGWCFQSSDERKKTIMRYIGLNCAANTIMKDKKYKKTLYWLAE